MSYEYHWFDSEHTIIQMDISGQVTWDQWNATIDKIAEEIKNTPHRVDIIFHDTVGMPKGNPMPHLKATRTKLYSYPNMGLMVTVSSPRISSFVEMIIDVIRRDSKDRSNHNGGFVTTMDEALKRINESRSKSQANT